MLQRAVQIDASGESLLQRIVPQARLNGRQARGPMVVKHRQTRQRRAACKEWKAGRVSSAWLDQRETCEVGQSRDLGQQNNTLHRRAGIHPSHAKHANRAHRWELNQFTPLGQAYWGRTDPVE